MHLMPNWPVIDAELKGNSVVYLPVIKRSMNHVWLSLSLLPECSPVIMQSPTANPFSMGVFDGLVTQACLFFSMCMCNAKLWYHKKR